MRLEIIEFYDFCGFRVQVIHSRNTCLNKDDKVLCIYSTAKEDSECK